MMSPNRARSEAHRRRVGRIETLEDRALLTIIGPTSTTPAMPFIRPVVAEVQPAEVQGPVDRSVTAKGAFAVKTLAKGYMLSRSNDLAHVGINYAKLAVAPSTARVGAAYLSAALKGDTKRLDQLGHTNLVKSVGQSFRNLTNSSLVQHVGDKFSQFGQSVRNQAIRLFS